MNHFPHLSRPLVLALGLALGSVCSPSFAQKVVKIGVAGPYTGGAASYGKDFESAVKLAIEDANAAGIKLGGEAVRFELISEDDAGDPKQAVSVATRLADQKVAGVVVWGDTDAVEAYGIAAEQTPVFWLDPSEPRDELPTKRYAEYRGVTKIKTYVAGVDDAKKAVEAIRKCKF